MQEPTGRTRRAADGNLGLGGRADLWGEDTWGRHVSLPPCHSFFPSPFSVQKSSEAEQPTPSPPSFSTNLYDRQALGSQKSAPRPVLFKARPGVEIPAAARGLGWRIDLCSAWALPRFLALALAKVQNFNILTASPQLCGLVW